MIPAALCSQEHLGLLTFVQQPVNRFGGKRCELNAIESSGRKMKALLDKQRVDGKVTRPIPRAKPSPLAAASVLEDDVQHFVREQSAKLCVIQLAHPNRVVEDVVPVGRRSHAPAVGRYRPDRQTHHRRCEKRLRQRQSNAGSEHPLLDCLQINLYRFGAPGTLSRCCRPRRSHCLGWGSATHCAIRWPWAFRKSL